MVLMMVVMKVNRTVVTLAALMVVKRGGKMVLMKAVL